MYADYSITDNRPIAEAWDNVKRQKTELMFDFTAGLAHKSIPDVFEDNNILTTPDILKLASSHDLQRMLGHQARSSSPSSTTPVTYGTPAQVLFPRMVTEAQEMYARGFEDALVKLYENQKQSPPNFSLADKVVTTEESAKEPNLGGAVDYSHIVGEKRPATESLYSLFNGVHLSQQTDSQTSERNNLSVAGKNNEIYDPRNVHYVDSSDGCASNFKGDLVSYDSKCSLDGYDNFNRQMTSSSFGSPSSSSSSTVSSTCGSPSLPCGIAPIDMVQQERIKLERKRQRNRVAATRCRERKLERIVTLEEQVKQLKARNVELTDVASVMREKICEMKMEIITHVNVGCQLMLH